MTFLSDKHAKQNPPPCSWPLFAALAIACLHALFRPDEGRGYEDDGDALLGFPSKIIMSSSVPSAPPRILRGTSGPPVAFHWVFPNGISSEAGGALHSRLLALDAHGYPAKASDCSGLRVNVSVLGKARLANASSTLVWQGSELELDIEGDVAEMVNVQVRIAGIASSVDALLYSYQVQFEPGPATNFSFRLRPAHSGWTASPPPLQLVSGGGLDTEHTWPTNTVMEVVVSATDARGNPVLFARDAKGKGAEWKQINVRADNGDCKVLSILQPDGAGNAHATFRVSKPGDVEMWLEHDREIGTRTPAVSLRDDTAKRYTFIGPSKARPRDWTRLDRSRLSAKDAKWHDAAGEVRDAFLHAWGSYKKHAWGADELRPRSKTGHDTFGNIGITLLDTLTTLWLMGLPDEFDEASNWVRDSLDFRKSNREVSVFELIIRALGGLLGAHALSGRQIFLDKAKDLGDRLLPALTSPSGLPMPRWDIRRGSGSVSREASILAEAGSLQLEFRHLTAVTGDAKYRKAADACFEAIQGTGLRGLLPVRFTPTSHSPLTPLQSNYQLGALADSYYEYLLKQWLQNPGEPRFKELWLEVMQELPQLAFPRPDPDSKKVQNIRLVESTTSGKITWKMDHLSCFIPGMVALGLETLPADDLRKDRRNETWRALAKGVTSSCVEMWSFTPSGLAPEWVSVQRSEPHNIQKATSGGAYSLIRPETAESLFYMYRMTGHEKYRRWGMKLFEAISNSSRVDGGFASVHDVYKKKPDPQDEMQSFVLAETFKYLFLLFSPADTLSLDDFVLNTEGHPLPRMASR